MAEKVDVLICGGGSAGLCAGVWLARCGVSFRILEKRAGALETGQADGVQCRTVEIFESFGLAETLLKEAYHAIEVAFWALVTDDSEYGIKRTNYTADTEPGLSHLPHVLLSQARINELLTQEMERAAKGPCIEYGYEVQGLEVDSENVRDLNAYPVTVNASKDGLERVYRAKYVLGSDGAHSVIRKSLGFKMIGDSSDSIWGVMDLYPRTTFPDIRKKCVINSKAGNLMIIPREGDFLVRFYIELKDVVAKDVTLEELHNQARLILEPYTLEVAETVWWSAYAIGQRLADQFHKDYRVFLSGDACHTHSPKAGQGMNVSLQDGYNIGWKLSAVLRRQAVPELLETYVSERQKIAGELIEFDRNWTKLFSSTYRQEHGIAPEEVQKQFRLAGRYTAGQAIHYENSIIVNAELSDSVYATSLTAGMRFPSAQVVRLADARTVQLSSALTTDSRWHVVAFAGYINSENLGRLRKLSIDLGAVVDAFTPSHVDRDTIINPILVLSSKRTEIEQNWIPDTFAPIVSKWKMKSLFKVFVDDEGYNSPHGHAYEKYGIEPTRGALVIVRPDQCMLPLLLPNPDKVLILGQIFPRYALCQISMVL
ncbi:FAD binding domain-containing protein [Annulohypoxylon maeteangense]|uniref:FAD binding domain-containing protein n=1 Tax=Annulohypoxylon maeteangense TaxID=1927788 RepID=UPI0020081538|nr:FAD binding domain-containing protein [Annulohypoxylon maeteangense]KAI0883449.1 FAD binding domain-containing protein [Annulohypoxylon maeteangense]